MNLKSYFHHLVTAAEKMYERQVQLLAILKEKRNAIGLAILLLVVSLPPLLTWGQGGLIAWGDMDLPELGASRSLEQAFYVWQGNRGLGVFMSLGLPDIFPHLLLTWVLTQVIGVSPHVAQAILYALCFELAGLSAFFLVRTILPQRRHFLASLFAGLFYVFNLSLLQITWGGLYKFLFAHATLPLFLAIYVRGLQSGDRKFLACWAIALFLGAGGLRPLPVGLACAAVLVSYTLFAACVYGRRIWLIGIKYALMGALVSAMWLLPIMVFALQGGGAAFEASSIRGAGTQSVLENTMRYQHLINTFRPLNWEWFQFEGWSQGGREPLYPFADSYNTMPALIIGSFMLPALAFAAALFTKQRDSQDITFFLALAFGGLLLTKGLAPPLQQAFVLLIQIPFFSGLFRNPFTKFQSLFTLSYAVLAGYTLNALRMKLGAGDSSGRRYLALASSLLLASLVLALVFPYWQGQVVRPRRVAVPEEYGAVADVLNADDEGYRVLSLPFFRSRVFVSYRWGYSGASGIMPYLLDRPIFLPGQAVGSLASEQANILLRKAVAEGDQATFSTLLYLYSMDKILVHRDADPNRYAEEFPVRQIERLLADDSITFVQSFGKLDLYAADSLPYLYATTDVDCVQGADDVIPFGLLKTAGPPRALLDTCSPIHPSFSRRVFVVAQASPRNDRAVFNVTVPVSATYELFSRMPITCPAESGLDCAGNLGNNNTLANQTNLYSPVVTLTLAPGTYRFQSPSPANDAQNPEQPYSNRLLVLRSVEDADGNNPAPEIRYSRINPTRYQVRVESATAPFLLVLAESYHPGWKVFVGGQELAESNHRPANGYANAWLIEKQGSYPITVEFTPQRFVYIGLTISCAAALLGLIYLTVRARSPRRFF